MTVLLHFGDLVNVRGAPEVGLVAEMRRADCRVLYPGRGQSVWVELRQVRPAGDEPTGSLARTIHLLLRALAAVEMEITMLGADRCRLVASHGATTPEELARASGLLGERLVAHVIRPHGMHRLESVIEFLV